MNCELQTDSVCALFAATYPPSKGITATYLALPTDAIGVELSYPLILAS